MGKKENLSADDPGFYWDLGTEKESGREIKEDEFEIPSDSMILDKEEPESGERSIKEYIPKKEKKIQEEKAQEGDGARTEIVKEKTEEQLEEGAEHNCIYVNYIIDGTLSFKKIFPAVYYVLSGSLEKLKEKKREYQGIRVKYGLTVFGDEIYTAKYKEGGEFTENEEAFLESVRNIVFQGGNDNGKENINEGVAVALKALADNSHESANRGIILLTDSLPIKINPDFSDLEGCQNKGLRFAVCFLKSNGYVPVFNIGNRYGEGVENNRNEFASILEIQELLTPDGKTKLNQIMLEVMRKSSVYQ